MLHRRCTFATLAAGALLMLPAARAAPATPTTASAQLQAAVNGNWRTARHQARDQYRHPIETLQFFGMQPDMTVVELSPGGGWYTEILAPYLHDHGHLIEATSPSRTFAAKLKANPRVYGAIAGSVPFAPPFKVQLGADNSAAQPRPGHAGGGIRGRVQGTQARRRVRPDRASGQAVFQRAGKCKSPASPARGLPDRSRTQSGFPACWRGTDQCQPERPGRHQRTSFAAGSRRPGKRTRGDAGHWRIRPHDAALREALSWPAHEPHSQCPSAHLELLS